MSERTMNSHEARAWRRLVELGAREVTLGVQPALDLSACRPRGAEQLADLIDAIIQVAGNSRAVRRHQDRKGRLVFVVTDAAPSRRSLPLPLEPAAARGEQSDE